VSGYIWSYIYIRTDLYLIPDVILLHIVYRGVDLNISMSPVFVAFTETKKQSPNKALTLAPSKLALRWSGERLYMDLYLFPDVILLHIVCRGVDLDIF